MRLVLRQALSLGFFITVLYHPLVAHQPHDPIMVVAMSPNYSQDQTLFLGTGALTMPLPESECAQMVSTNGGLTFSVMSGLPDHITQSFAFSPDFATDNTVFLGGRGGFFYSTDRGLTWTASPGPLANQIVVAVVVTPNFSTSNALFAITANNIYGSQDRGRTWQTLPNPAGVINFTSLAVSPNYAVDSRLILGTAANGIFVSKDYGHNWGLVTKGLTLPLVSALVFSPAFATDRTVFAVTTGSGVFMSDNGGGAWTAMNNGLTDLNGTQMALSPHFARDGTMWVATDEAGVFKSANRGVSWTPVGAPPRPLSNQTTAHFLTIAANTGPSGSVVLFLGMFEGLFTSNDGGASWVYCDTLPTRLVRDLQLSPDYPSDQTVVISTYGGGTVWSTDGGESWYFENTGLINSYTDAIAMSPNYAVDRMAFVGTVQGLERISGGSAKWYMMQMLGQKTFPRALGISPNFPQDSTIFIGTHLGINRPVTVTYNGQQFYSQGLFVSGDKGENWQPTGMQCNQPSSSCPNGIPVDSIAVSPNFAKDHTLFVGSSANGLFKSTHGAAGPFVALGPVPITVDPAVLPVAISPNYAADQTLVVSTSQSGVFKSINGGSSWSLLPGTNTITCFSIAFSPNYAHDRTIFLGTLQSGMLKSVDGGNSFQPTTLPGNYVTAVAVSPGYATDQTVFAASYLGLYKSIDGGSTWTYAAEPARQEEQRQFPPGAFNTIEYSGNWSLVSDPAASTIQYAGTQQSGASASLTFVGSGAEWVGLKSPTGGMAQVVLDGTVSATVNLQSSTIQERATLWIVRGLQCGIHTVTINALPGANQNVTLDALDVWQANCSSTGPSASVKK